MVTKNSHQVAAHREEYAKEISSLQNKLSVAQASFVKDTEKRETEYRKLTRQVAPLRLTLTLGPTIETH